MDYLVNSRGFTRLQLSQEVPPTLDKLHISGVYGDNGTREPRIFSKVECLLEFVTKYWKRRWVTTDIWNEEILENLLRRPSFILVSVDAPVSLRWKRFRER